MRPRVVTIHLLNGSIENNFAFETASKSCSPTSFPAPHCIPVPSVTIRFVFLANSGIVIVIENVSVSTVEPNVASFDQLEIAFRLQVKNISQN